MKRHALSRRTFLKSSAVATTGSLVPYWMTAASGQDKPKKDERPLVGQIGCGGQGNYITNRARAFGDIVAVSDVDSMRAETAKAKQGGGKADIYADYRELLDRKDISVVTIGTPDHWHTKLALDALAAGKDVYCEKPLTLTIEEGKLICQAVKKSGRVFQVGTQQRSEGPFAKAVAICRAGRLGKIKRITVAIGGAPKSGPLQKEMPPETLDWERWLGQAPLVDYIPRRCHYQFRWWYEYSGGKMTDWGAHHVDIAHWALGVDDTGPIRIEGTAQHPVPFKDGYPTIDNQYNTAISFDVKATFADGVELIIRDKTDEFDNGVMIEGTDSRLFVNRGKLTGAPVEALKDDPLPDDAIKNLLRGQQHGHHMRNFFECIKTREKPISDVFSHHRAITTCHLANICIRLGRTLKWDPTKEEILDDADANSWQSRQQRKGYELT